MRVNISYSVELDEVLPNIRALVKTQHENLKTNLKKLTPTLSGEYEEKKLGEGVHAMKTYQGHLKEMDLKLNEMIGILVGYQQLLLDQESPRTPPVGEPSGPQQFDPSE